MTDVDLDRLAAENAERRKRKSAAEPGPYSLRSSVAGYEIECPSRVGGLMGTADDPTWHFLVAAANDPVEDVIDALLAEVRRLRVAR